MGFTGSSFGEEIVRRSARILRAIIPLNGTLNQLSFMGSEPLSRPERRRSAPVGRVSRRRNPTIRTTVGLRYANPTYSLSLPKDKSPSKSQGGPRFLTPIWQGMIMDIV